MENQPDGLEEARRIFEVDAEIKRLQSIRANHVRAYEMGRVGVRIDVPAPPVDDESFNMELLRASLDASRIGRTSTHAAGVILDELPARKWRPKSEDGRARRGSRDGARIRAYLERIGFVEATAQDGSRTGKFSRKV